MVSEEYDDYLRSPRWQQLKSERLKIDNYKCQRCGRPFDLQVHHLWYPQVLGQEDPYRDLITLCDYCHQQVEQEKKEYKEKQRSFYELQKEIRTEQSKIWSGRVKESKAVQVKMLYQIIKDRARNDLSNVGIGKRDYCKREVIVEDFGPVIESTGFQLGYIQRVSDYFRNRRYEVILDMLDHGCTPWQIHCQTLFNYEMIRRVANDPDRAIYLLNKEREENE